MVSGKSVCQASESVNDVPSCECYAARQTDMIIWSCRGHHCRKTWPPIVFPLLVNAPSSRLIGDLNSRPSDLELGALTKWLASQMLVWVSAGFYAILYVTLYPCPSKLILLINNVATTKKIFTSWGYLLKKGSMSCKKTKNFALNVLKHIFYIFSTQKRRTWWRWWRRSIR